MLIIKQPYSPFPIRHRHDCQFQIGILPPSPILQTVDTHAVHITRLTIVCRVERNAIHLETDMAMMILLDHRKDRTIGSLHAPIGMTAIKSTRKTVSAIHTNYRITFREILLDTRFILFSIIIRLQRTCYLRVYG